MATSMAERSSSKLYLPYLPEHPLQPTKISLHRGPLVKTKVALCSFQNRRFNTWKGLHYDASRGVAFLLQLFSQV